MGNNTMVIVVINILKVMYVGHFVKYLLLRQILTKIGKCRQILLIIPSISILENVIGGRLIVPCGQKDGQTNN